MLRRCVAYLFGCCLTLLTIPVSAQYINRTNSVLALAGYKDPGLRSAETCRTYGKGNLLSPMMFNAQLANYFAKTYGVSDGPGLPVQIMTDAEIKAAEKYYEDALAKSTLTSSPTCAEVLQLIVDARNQFADRAFSRADAIANKNRAKCSDEIRNKLPVSTYCRNGDTILRLFAYSASSPDNFADVFKSNGITNLLLMAGKGDLKGVQGMMANPQNGLVNANSADPAEGLTPLIAAAEHFSVTVAINGVDLGMGQIIWR